MSSCSGERRKSSGVPAREFLDSEMVSNRCGRLRGFEWRCWEGGMVLNGVGDGGDKSNGAGGDAERDLRWIAMAALPLRVLGDSQNGL